MRLVIDSKRLRLFRVGSEGGKCGLPWTSWGAARGAAKAGEMRRAADKKIVGRIVIEFGRIESMVGGRGISSIVGGGALWCS